MHFEYILPEPKSWKFCYEKIHSKLYNCDHCICQFLDSHQFVSCKSVTCGHFVISVDHTTIANHFRYQHILLRLHKYLDECVHNFSFLLFNRICIRNALGPKEEKGLKFENAYRQIFIHYVQFFSEWLLE
ncbi:hypothetical protein B4U80_06706 [Leptotrombidium deliense]|uniref:Uncharacterized protein n=1 Tax=Leptotrombidium deliense TaxID=299467 RepID=A0A443SUK6_9ACAR|nr:hypothetical protein B4U80_06706 [Leptotrombidium deliense]